MNFIENIIDQVLINIDDFISIPSFILNRFIVLPFFLIMYALSLLLASPFLMCIYILGFYGYSSGERGFIEFFIVIVKWLYMLVHIFIFLE